MEESTRKAGVQSWKDVEAARQVEWRTLGLVQGRCRTSGQTNGQPGLWVWWCGAEYWGHACPPSSVRCTRYQVQSRPRLPRSSATVGRRALVSGHCGIDCLVRRWHGSTEFGSREQQIRLTNGQMAHSHFTTADSQVKSDPSCVLRIIILLHDAIF
jgi:hypothetical protein